MRHPLEQLMRDHPRGTDPQTAQALAILLKEIPADMFSMMQWSVGLPYYEQRLLDWKLSGDACLDFGCGTGNWTLAASRFFSHVIGVDTHHQRLRSAIMIRDALGVRNVIFEPDLNAASADASLDCILLYNVLPYIGNRAETIQRLIALLKPTGRLVVSFNEIGICPYYLFSGIRYLQGLYVKKAFAVPAYGFINRFLRARTLFESTHGYVRTAAAVSFFHTIGFDPLWKSWDTTVEGSGLPLFPHRTFGVPFFREMVLQKTMTEL